MREAKIKTLFGELSLLGKFESGCDFSPHEEKKEVHQKKNAR